jgi:hypothetical protein
LINQDGRHTPYLIGVYDGHIYTKFFTVEPFSKDSENRLCLRAATYLYRNCNNCTVFAHNLFRFDFTFIAEALFKRIIIEQGSLATDEAIQITHGKEGIRKVTIKKPSGEELQFLDSYNFLPMPLGRAGKAFSSGVKVPRPTSFQNLSVQDLPRLSQELNDYNFRNCKFLFDTLKAFESTLHKQFGVSVFTSSTLVGISYRIFLRETADLRSKRIIVPDQRNEKIIRSAYRGGRTEIFNHYASASSTQTLHCVDFASLYPAVARHYASPTGFLEQVSGASIDISSFGIYYCHVAYDPASENEIPYLSVRYGEDIIYPTGTWSTYYTTHEIQQALLRGYRITTVCGLRFSSFAHVFDQFVQKVHAAKREAEITNNNGKRLIAKLLLNSIFGRLAQRPHRMFTKLIWNGLRFDDSTVSEIHNLVPIPQTAFSFAVYTEKKEDQNRLTGPINIDIAPQLSAFVNAYARTHLQVVLEYITGSGGTVLYVDTDSVIYAAPSCTNQLTAEHINQHLFDKGLVSLEDLSNSLGVVKEIYAKEVVEETLFVAPKTYLIRTDKELYAKTAGIGLAIG